MYFVFRPGPNAAHAPVHMHPGGVFSCPLGRYVDSGVAGLPICPHPHRPCQDVRAAPHLQRQRDSMCKSTTGGRHWLLFFFFQTFKHCETYFLCDCSGVRIQKLISINLGVIERHSGKCRNLP